MWYAWWKAVIVRRHYIFMISALPRQSRLWECLTLFSSSSCAHRGQKFYQPSKNLSPFIRMWIGVRKQRSILVTLKKCPNVHFLARQATVPSLRSHKTVQRTINEWCLVFVSKNSRSLFVWHRFDMFKTAQGFKNTTEIWKSQRLLYCTECAHEGIHS